MKLVSTRIDPARFERPNAGGSTKPRGQNGQQIDENYLNQKIMYLNSERQRIHDLAEKYGLENNVKFANL